MKTSQFEIIIDHIDHETLAYFQQHRYSSREMNKGIKIEEAKLHQL